MKTGKSALMQPSLRAGIDPFLAMDVVARANKLSRRGVDVISMAVGQPSACAPKSALEAASLALKSGPIGYTDATGIEVLRHRIAQHYKQTYSVDIAPAQVIVTTGSSAGFILGFLALFEPGARIAVPSPGYPAYRNIIKALSMEPVEIATNEECRWALNGELLAREHAKSKIDGILFANPNNPNGTMVNREQFVELFETANRLGIRFISDEIYHGLTYEIEAVCALELSEDVIIINSFSKYFCMTGWRIGWMIVPEPMIETINRLQQNLFICAPEISQIAAVAAFDGIDEMETVRNGYRKNRQLFMERLPALGLETIQPIDGAFYAYACATPWFDKEISNSMSLAALLLDETGVAITPGLDFDIARGADWLRFSFAGEYSRMAEAFERLQIWCENR